MGFFGGLLKDLTGGSDSKQQSSSSSQSGFSLLPPQIQQAYNSYAGTLNSSFGQNNTGAFTPLPYSGAEETAYNNINAGFAPTASSINSDIGMQMNPYNSSVIDEINRQANGQYSIFKQAQDNAGQFGSNRSLLGANDVDLSRTNQIGGFLQGEYDKSLNNALTTLPQARAADASNQLAVGTAQRSLAAQTAQAPFANLQMLGQLLGILPSNGGSTSTASGSGSSDSVGGIGSLFAGK